ncbi:hypothetical protein E4T50_16647 [Aureobasidium sp. EXF-12298]|nr:hypothetical protein E4T50_16647 [Aureobasidium sp. EXF-12298]
MAEDSLAHHEHILEMFQFMTQCTALNPPVLETYTSSYSLIERRQFADMIELANHILFLARIQTHADLAGQVQSVLESWVLRGEPMPNQLIYETAELFASIGYRFRVLVSTANNATLEDVANPSDVILSGSRIQQDYTLFTPWAMDSYEGQYHDSNVPQQQQSRRTSVYRIDPKVDLNCVGCPSCNFCTKVRKDILKHEAQHWESIPCICSRLNQRAMAVTLDTKLCQCGRLTIDENARILRNWEDEQTGHLIQRFGTSETMPTFTNTTAIQMQHDMTDPNMGQYLNINSQGWH